MEYPLLKLEELRMRYRYKRVSWPVTVVLFGIAGVVITLLLVYTRVISGFVFSLFLNRLQYHLTVFTRFFLLSVFVNFSIYLLLSLVVLWIAQYRLNYLRNHC
jgi:hypothetical protein